MSLYGSRDAKRLAAARRAQFALKTALDRIDYMEGVREELAALERGELVLVSDDDNAQAAVDALKKVAPKSLPAGD